MSTHSNSPVCPCRTPTLAAALATVTSLALTVSSGHAQSITNLGVLDPSHQFGQSVGVSGDGQHAAANSGVEIFNQMRGFRWSRGGAVQDLGNPSGAANVTATAINWDGGVIAGTSYPAASACQAFCWTAQDGLEILPSLASDEATSATGINSNGQFICGIDSTSNGDRAVRWNGQRGPEDLGVLSGGTYSLAWAISGHGDTITGFADTQDGERAFIWTQAAGMQALPANGFSGGLGINTDGSVIVGYVATDAARWNAGSLQILGTLPGGSFSTAYCVSGNGLIAGGFSDSEESMMPVATIWSDALGVADLNTYLPTLGINLAGWNLTTTTGISFDGNTLVGVGTFEGADRGWIVTIPAPGPVGLLSAAGALAIRRRRPQTA